MAERLVWLRSDRTPEKGAFAFPIDSSSNRLILDGIASYFGLDPTSLTVGRLVLLKDANGHSVMDSNEIRQVSSAAGLGDGLSQETAIVISGAGVFHTNSLYKKRKTSAFDHEANLERQYALDDEFFMGNKIYSYIIGLVHAQPEDVGKKVSKFVGSIQVQTRTRTQKTGVVTLVKPNGACITAEECIGNDNNDGKEMVIMVSFPQLGGASYECRVASRENAVAVLEPVQTQSFDACMLVDKEALEPADEALTFNSFPSLGVVPVLIIDLVGPETIMLPVAEVRQIGMPVFSRSGRLGGIVVQVNMGKLPRKPSRKKLRSLHGKELHIQSVQDINKQFKCTSEREKEVLQRAVLQNQLVECAFPQKWKGPIEEWEEEHPLQSFSSSGSGSGSGFLRKPPLQSIIEPMTREELDELFSEVIVEV